MNDIERAQNLIDKGRTLRMFQLASSETFAAEWDEAQSNWVLSWARDRRRDEFGAEPRVWTGRRLERSDQALLETIAEHLRGNWVLRD
jgi:hypothetical protein